MKKLKDKCERVMESEKQVKAEFEMIQAAEHAQFDEYMQQVRPSCGLVATFSGAVLLMIICICLPVKCQWHQEAQFRACTSCHLFQLGVSKT